MRIEKIKLINFRNYEKLELKNLDSGMNILYGKNAQGKTNLLEAIHICGNGKSFRVGGDARTVRFSCESAYLQVEYDIKNRKQTIEVLIGADGKKSFKRNGIPVKSIKEMLGNLFVVVFSPEDMRMAKEAPSLRRAFLDGEISKIRPSYVDALKNYGKIIAEKNAALKKRNIRDMEGIIRAYNGQLENYIKIIIKNRKIYLEKLNEYVDQSHREISGGAEKIEIRYRATMQEQKIEEQLERMIEKEIADCGCCAGPHRDDMEIRINGKDVKVYASQGQLRTLMLSIKIACLKILEDTTGQTPVLLLDDVFSELDETRKKNLVKSLEQIQVFLTTANQKETGDIKKGVKYQVKSGRISAQL